MLLCVQQKEANLEAMAADLSGQLATVKEQSSGEIQQLIGSIQQLEERLRNAALESQRKDDANSELRLHH